MYGREPLGTEQGMARCLPSRSPGAATNPGSSWKPLNQEREQTRSPSQNFPFFFFLSLFLRRLKLVALCSCLYSNDRYFCIQCEYPLHPLRLLPPDPGSPIPVPKTGDPVSLAACRLLKGIVHSTRVLTLKRFVKFGSSIRCIFFPF